MSDNELERFRINQLRKQHLVSESQISLFDIIKTHLGLHSTNYWTPYLSLYARIGEYNPKKLFNALNQGNQLVRIHAFRKTVFVVHISNLSMLIQAMGPLLYKFARKAPDIKNMSEEELDSLNKIFIERLNRTGKIFLTQTTLKGKYVLRMAIGSRATQKIHIRQAWDLINSEAKRLLQEER